jgi:WD40 repeat protein
LAPKTQRGQARTVGELGLTKSKEIRGAPLPPDDRINLHLQQDYEAMPAERFQLRKTFKGHQRAVSGIAIHPTKPIVATVSDDRTWKMWSISRGELIMSGDGHRDWIGACDFHPGGGLLATASGDGTIKLWDFVQAKCTATLSDHTQAVWDCAFHDTGDFLVSASMDHTARVFDVTTGQLRQTIRGHVDSVNRVCFQPFSNNICTASGDKTVSLWDIRSGLCIQTFYGHENAVLAASFAHQGDTIASADSDGIIKLWDVRMVAERSTLSAPNGRIPVNDVKFDLSGKTLMAACDDATIKCFNTLASAESAYTGQMDGFEGPVQALAVDPNGAFVLGAGSDKMWRVFGT